MKNAAVHVCSTTIRRSPLPGLFAALILAATASILLFSRPVHAAVVSDTVPCPTCPYQNSDRVPTPPAAITLPDSGRIVSVTPMETVVSSPTVVTSVTRTLVTPTVITPTVVTQTVVTPTVVTRSAPVTVYPSAAAPRPARPSWVVPLLSDLRKPVEETKTEEDDAPPELPAPVAPEKNINVPASLCPPDAIWYVEASDAVRSKNGWNASPVGKFLAEPPMELVFRNNRFGLEQLFADLPSSVITQSRVGAISSALEMGAKLLKSSRKMAMAGYIDPAGNFSFLLLFDIGLDRIPAFEEITRWETAFFLAHPGSAVHREKHIGNFIDVWTLRGSSETAPAEVAGGFVENMAVISNNAALARQVQTLYQNRGGDTLASSRWGKRLAESAGASEELDAIGFIRIDTLLSSLGLNPIARKAVERWADYLGRGGRDGEAIYYGATVGEAGCGETILVPARGVSTSSSLMEVLTRRLKPADKWTTPGAIPNQPSPMLFVAARLEGRHLGTLLGQPIRLFGVSDHEDFTIPPEIRPLFSNEIIAILNGEIGASFYESGQEGNRWLMLLSCKENPEKKIIKAEFPVERAGVTINWNSKSAASASWMTQPCWAAVSQDTFRHIGGHFLAIASHGELLVSMADQLVAGTSLADNRDFNRAVQLLEAGHGLFFYFNLPEFIIRQYTNLSTLMRQFYPRSSGLNSRPPLTTLRRYAKGVIGSVAPLGEKDEFARLNLHGPIPMFGLTAAGVVMQYPKGLRQEGRAEMEKSRANLQALWLRLQLYSNRYGHFPESLGDLKADARRAGTDSAQTLEQEMIAPAALSRMTPKDAADKSYKFLSGLTINDEPDLPIIYESEPWSEDFADMYPEAANKSRKESGAFIPFRQYIRLDGKLVTLPEHRFQQRMLPRMLERE